jgi:TPR repeat protein
MSAPVREPDDGPSKDGPLDYAPKRIRRPEQDQIPADADRGGDAVSQNTAPELGQPPWKRSKQRGSFAGDAAIVELRSKLALAPQRLPEPLQPSTGVKYGFGSWLAGVAVVTAVGIIGYRLGSPPPTSSPQLALGSSESDQQGLASQRSVAAAHPLQSVPPFASPAATKAIVPKSDEQKSRDAVPTAPPRLTVGAVRRQLADEATRLTVSAADAGAHAAVVISGLAPGSTLSAGTQVAPNTWRLSVEELPGAAITPPDGFVGAVDLMLELRLADNTVADRRSLRLEWSGHGAPAPAKSQPRRLAPNEIALMVKNGTEYMANGNVGAARMMLRPAAEAGDPVAAFALAETFDPLVLRKLNAKGGITPNVGLAQTWYQKAKDLGSALAPERLESLARLRE